jgi:hypothetical protein
LGLCRRQFWLLLAFLSVAWAVVSRARVLEQDKPESRSGHLSL